MTDKSLFRTTLSTVVAFAIGFLTPVPNVKAQTKADSASARKVDFVREIQPLLERSCFSCHGPKVQMAGLRLDSKELAFAGGRSGKVIYAGKASESSLFQRIAGIGDQA